MDVTITLNTRQTRLITDALIAAASKRRALNPSDPGFARLNDMVVKELLDVIAAIRDAERGSVSDEIAALRERPHPYVASRGRSFLCGSCGLRRKADVHSDSEGTYEDWQRYHGVER